MAVAYVNIYLLIKLTDSRSVSSKGSDRFQNSISNDRINERTNGRKDGRNAIGKTLLENNKFVLRIKINFNKTPYRIQCEILIFHNNERLSLCMNPRTHTECRTHKP